MKKTTSYIVQPINNNNNNNNINEAELEEDSTLINAREINSIEELPYYVKFTIKGLSNKAMFRFLLISVIFSHIHTMIVFSQMVGSLAVGVSVGFLFLLGHLCDFLPLPDFSKGFFLDILLSNRALVEKVNTEIKGGVIFGIVFVGVFLMGLFLFFFTYEFSQTDTLGPNTFYITLVIVIFGYPSSFIATIYGGGVVMIPSMSVIWENKVKKYLKNVRNILILENSNDTKSIIHELSKEQKHISTFARKMSTGLNSFYTFQLLACLSWVAIGAFFIATPGAGGKKSRFGILIGFTGLFMMCLGWLFNILRGIGRANRVWENAIKLYLSDAKIQDAKVRLGWSEAIFNAWLCHHECKGLKAFGEQITTQVIRRGFSLFASIITVGIYFAAREELRSFLS